MTNADYTPEKANPLLRSIELLSPAKDAETGIAAIRCGADAVYIGPQRFGAREAAGNSLEEIRTMVDFAHLYYSRVYATVNTLLFDSEIEKAVELMHELSDAGVDGFIIQDMGLLEMKLPDRPIIASTQTNNVSVDKVKFLEDVGVSRVILARELTLDQIHEIRKQTSVELECFVHGALCVGLSGQCYMSCSLGGRSGNRGQCAQPCRMRYSLVNPDTEEVLAKDLYLLSLKDMNRSAHLESLVDAGITSFKIEGRLKGIPYVSNVTGYYRQQLDTLLDSKGLKRRSSGRVSLDFEPDPDRTFNRGYTDYGVSGNTAQMASILTSKATGQYLGKVLKVSPKRFLLDTKIELHSGDGICFFDTGNVLRGSTVNHADGQWITPREMEHLHPGQDVYRNHDHQFEKLLNRVPAERKIRIAMRMYDSSEGIRLEATDEDGNTASILDSEIREPAAKQETACDTIKRQLTKLGNTIFGCDEFLLELNPVWFFPVAVLNQLRRDVVEAMLDIRKQNRPVGQSLIRNEDATPYPARQLSFTGNVLNQKAREFYEKHGVEAIEPAAESGIHLSGEKVMITKYCILQQLGLCDGKRQQADDLVLTNEEGRHFRVSFSCGDCGMDIIASE